MKPEKPIYNHKNKNDFIKFYMERREIKLTSLISLFRKTAQYEINSGLDCYSFSKKQILDMYSQFNAKSVNVLLNYNSILKAYCAWQNENKNITIISAYDGISQKDLIPLIPSVATQLLTREDVDYIENNLLNWTDKAIVECLWEGVAGNSMKELISISKSTLNTEEKTLTFKSGKVIQITDRLIELLNKAFLETEYTCYGQSKRVKKLFGVNCLYKTRDNAHAIDSEDISFRWVYRKIQLFRNHVNIKKFTMKNISTSGMYYYLQKGMNKNKLDLREFLLTDDGQKLMDKYGYTSEYRIDNVIHRYKQFM